MKNLRLFICALLTCIVGVVNAQTWTWTGETPAAGNFYILTGNSSWLYGTTTNLGNNRYYGVKSVYSEASEFTLSGAQSGPLAFKLNGNTVYMRESSGTSQQPSSTQETFYYKIGSASAGFYITNYSDGTFSSSSSGNKRYLNLEDGSTCNFPRGNSGNKTVWKFISTAQVTAYNNYIAAWNKLNNLYSANTAKLASKSSDINNALKAATNYSNASGNIGDINSVFLDCLTLATQDSPMDITCDIVNPNATDNTGWTLTTANYNNSANERYDGQMLEVADWWATSFSSSAKQTLKNLPAGYYKLETVVQASEGCSVQLQFGDTKTVAVSGHAISNGNTGVYGWDNISLEAKLATASDVEIAALASANAQFNWSNWDNFRLTYYGTLRLDDVYEQLKAEADKYAPIADWCSYEAYATAISNYDTYKANGTDGYNGVDNIKNAISEMRNAYLQYIDTNIATYVRGDITSVFVINPTYDDAENGWDKTQNSTGGYADGISQWGNNYYYTANSQVRHATIYQEGITLPAGLYCLSANLNGDILDDKSTYIYATDGAVAHWDELVFKGNTWYGYLTTANEWTNVKTYIYLTEETTLRIGALSWGKNQNGSTKGNFAVDDWKLERIYYALDKEDGVVTAYGPVSASALNEALTADVYCVDLTNASGISNLAVSTTNNQNVLIYANNGQVSNTKNVVIDNTCTNLVLTDGYPFKATKAFTANNASYMMTAIAESGDKKFGTLMLPFAVEASAYKLDQGVNFGEEIHATSITTIPANTPVLVTKSGDYTASNVNVEATNDTHTNGELVGTYKAMTSLPNTYVLQNHSGRVAFFMVNGTQPTVNPFRAYIKAQTPGVKALNVIFDDEETAIEEIENGKLKIENSIFDLSGRRVQKAQKGIYIVNGKKIVLK